MKNFFIALILSGMMIGGTAPAFTYTLQPRKTAYSQSYQKKERGLKKIEVEINKIYNEIHRVKKSQSLSQIEKQIIIKRLKNQINAKEREAQRLRSKYRHPVG